MWTGWRPPRLAPGRRLQRRARQLPRVLRRADQDWPGVVTTLHAVGPAHRGEEYAIVLPRASSPGAAGPTSAGRAHVPGRRRDRSEDLGPVRALRRAAPDNPPGGARTCLHIRLARVALTCAAPVAQRCTCAVNTAARSRYWPTTARMVCRSSRDWRAGRPRHSRPAVQTVKACVRLLASHAFAVEERN